MLRAVTIGVLLLAALAGCAQRPTTVDSPSTAIGPPASPAHPFDRPANWSRGQWWTYAVTLDGQPGDPTTLIVTENGSAQYVLDTDSRRAAAFDAEFDASYIGPIGKQDLSGRQQAAPVEYFRWPLNAGSFWTTTWDGAEREIHALGPGTSGQFELEARQNGTTAVRYSYDPVAGFFGHFDFVDPDDRVGFGMRLASSGVDYRGSYVRATAQRLFTSRSQDQPAASDFQDVDVAPGTSELVIRYAVDCTAPAGAWDLTMAPFDTGGNQSQSFGDRGTCPGTRANEHRIQTPIPGSWGYRGQYLLAAPPNRQAMDLVAVTFTSAELPP